MLFNTLIWLGLPSLMFMPIVILLWIGEWIRTLQQVGTGLQHAGRQVSSLGEKLRAQFLARAVWFAVTQGAFTAFVFASFRLVAAMTIPDGSGLNIASGKSFRWAELWINLTTYSSADQRSLQAFWIAVGWILALNVANLTPSRVLATIVKLPVLPVAALCTFAAIGIGVVGLMVLSLATWLHNPGYNIEMVSLYVFWVVLLLGVAGTLGRIPSQAEAIYGHR